MKVTINVDYTDLGDTRVEVEEPAIRTVGDPHGLEHDEATLDALLDEAVARVRRVYRKPQQ